MSSGPLLSRLRAYLGGLARAHASPGRLFAACVTGAILGSTPFFGLHLPLCLAAARVLKLNPVAVYGAANVSVPPLAPFLALACIDVGSRLLTGHGAPFTVDALRAMSPWTLAGEVFASWLLGSVFVGAALGATLGALVVALSRLRSGPARDAFDEAATATAARFVDAAPYHRHYVPWKIRLDPVYRAVCAELPEEGELVELGCGLGILPLLVVSLSPRWRARGIDWDDAKVRDARRACEGTAASVERGDVRTHVPQPCDALALVDVLHYFDSTTQDAILARAAAALRPGGTLFVREGDAGGSGSRWTRAVERLAVRAGWNRSAAPPRFRPISDLVGTLDRLGLSCRVGPVAGPMHPGNVLIRARRPTSAVAAPSEGPPTQDVATPSDERPAPGLATPWLARPGSGADDRALPRAW